KLLGSTIDEWVLRRDLKVDEWVSYVGACRNLIGIRDSYQWKPRLTTLKTPPLRTLLRARPPTMKSTKELEKNEREKAPKCKTRPLNKKVLITLPSAFELASWN
nr:protein TPX2-like isoform X1 [Tanacetum cinerariifolium]